MTFEIDEIGFYTMRNGGLCEVVHINETGSTCAVLAYGSYHSHRVSDGKVISSSVADFDIMSKWRRKEKITINSVCLTFNLKGQVVSDAEYHKLSKQEQGKCFAHTYPSQEIEVFA